MEKIEVGYRHIVEGPFGKDYYHKFLLYTDKNGQQYTISGWTDENNQNTDLPFGNIRVRANWAYDNLNADHPDNPNAWYYDRNSNPISSQKQHRELIAEAPDLSEKWKEMTQNAINKDNIYPYDYLRQNSNTLADAVLREADLPEPKMDGMFRYFAPGSGKQMDKDLVPKNPNDRSISDIKELSHLEENDLLQNHPQYAYTLQSDNQKSKTSQAPDISRPQAPDSGPFNDPFLDRYYAAIMAGDSQQVDKAALDFAQSTQGQEMAQQGQQLLTEQQAQQQQQERQLAQTQHAPVMKM